MGIDTLRLIMTLDCNLNCPYCCNKQEQFSSQFRKARFTDLDFTLYKNVCITGGEPFMHKLDLVSLIRRIPRDKNLIIYTNGLLVDCYDSAYLRTIPNLIGVSVGLHGLDSITKVRRLEKHLPVRFCIQDIYYEECLKLYPDRVNPSNLKGWKMDDCNRDNEDRVILV